MFSHMFSLIGQVYTPPSAKYYVECLWVNLHMIGQVLVSPWQDIIVASHCDVKVFDPHPFQMEAQLLTYHFSGST